MKPVVDYSMPRILACLHACRGLPTELLKLTKARPDEIAYRYVAVQRDWLYAALDALLIRFGVADVREWDRAREIRDLMKKNEGPWTSIIEHNNALTRSVCELQKTLKRYETLDAEYAERTVDLCYLLRDSLEVNARLGTELADSIASNNELTTMLAKAYSDQRLNIEPTETGVRICWHDHDKSDKCKWVHYTRGTP